MPKIKLVPERAGPGVIIAGAICPDAVPLTVVTVTVEGSLTAMLIAPIGAGRVLVLIAVKARMDVVL